jgi:TolA-binding protein
MKNRSLLVIAITAGLTVSAQSSRFYNEPILAEQFKEAKEYFQKEQYSLAWPLLKELKLSIRETDRANTGITVQEINYYYTVCALKQNEGRSEDLARDFLETEKNTARVQMMNFHLAEYYFRKQDFTNAVMLYEQSNMANLSNREIADMKFHQGYGYFTQQRFAQAKPLFNTIRVMKDDPNYLDANYYYGFLAFRDRQYGEALECFKIVEHHKSYSSVVPYYIAQVYYIQGKKDESIAYIQNKLKTGNTQFYDLELKQLIGHAHFERKEYAMALPYLEEYVNRSQKVRREDLYELSYCYYQAGQLNKAIEGFKQLSGKEDSLSQHAMYLLGDAYLKTGQKANARSAFLFCAANSSNKEQKEISRYQYAKLSYELGYQDEALNGLRSFLNDYPASSYNAEAKELLVAVLTNTNNYRDALTLMEGLNNPSPNTKRVFPRILYGRATELINDGRMAEADAMLDRALKEPNNSAVLPFIHFWKGEIAYRSNRLDDAIRFYHAYINAGSPSGGEANAVHARYNLGYCYLRKENYAAALSYFEPIGRNPSLGSDALTQDAYIRTADCYYMNRDYTKAKTMYDNVIKFSWPAEDYATFQNAMIAGIKNPNDKVSLLNTMNRKFPASELVTEANMEIAGALLSQERFRDAIPYLNQVINSQENSSHKPSAYSRLALAYYNLNNNVEALKNYDILVSKYPNSPEADAALDNVKAIYVEMNRPDEYAAFMRKAGKPLTVDAEDSLTYNAALTLLTNGNTNAALTAFQNYLKRFPDPAHYVQAHFYIGEIFNGKKDWANALKGYEVVAEEAPNPFAEKSILEAARIYFFEIKNYAKAENYYAQLKDIAINQENKLEAMRGLLRSQYQLQKWKEAEKNAKDLANAKGSSTDDKTLASMVIAKSYEVSGQYDLAIANFKTVVQLNKAALAAEARYSIAYCWFQLNKPVDAEKAAFETINKSGSYDYWVTKSYILLGDIFFKQKDYFNAKATFQSVVDNSVNPELKTEAQMKLSKVIDEESKGSKLGQL